jgi:hypothetical protein
MLTMMKHMATKDLHLRAATNFQAMASTAASAANVLRQAAKRLYGASEGRIFVESWDFYAGANCASCGGTTCDLCFKDICSACGTGSDNGPYAEVLGCSTGLCTGPWSQWVGGSYLNGFVDDATSLFGASRLALHELGHKIGGLPDEYGTNNYDQCGHTVMATNLWRPYATNFCNQYNHNRDGYPGIAQDDPNSNQAVLLANGLGPDWQLGIQITPDSYDYADFEFGNALGQVSTTGALPSPIPVPWGTSHALVGLTIALLGLGCIRAIRREWRKS